MPVNKNLIRMVMKQYGFHGSNTLEEHQNVLGKIRKIVLWQICVPVVSCGICFAIWNKFKKSLILALPIISLFLTYFSHIVHRVDDEMEKEKMIMCEVRPPFPLLDRKRKKGRPLLARARFSLGNLFFMENYTCHWDQDWHLPCLDNAAASILRSSRS